MDRKELPQTYYVERFDLLEPKVIQLVAKVMGEGAEKYGVDNWKNIPASEHLNHALAHIFSELDGDTSEDHMINAMCRLMFARSMKNGGI